MKLKEIIQQILEKKFGTQTALAKHLGVVNTDVQRLARAGRNLEKQFQMFLEINDLCEKLGIDPRKPPEAKDLQEKKVAIGALDYEIQEREGDFGGAEKIMSKTPPKSETPPARPAKASRARNR